MEYNVTKPKDMTFSDSDIQETEFNKKDAGWHVCLQNKSGKTYEFTFYQTKS